MNDFLLDAAVKDVVVKAETVAAAVDPMAGLVHRSGLTEDGKTRRDAATTIRALVANVATLVDHARCLYRTVDTAQNIPFSWPDEIREKASTDYLAGWEAACRAVRREMAAVRDSLTVEPRDGR